MDVVGFLGKKIVMIDALMDGRERYCDVDRLSGGKCDGCAAMMLRLLADGCVECSRKVAEVVEVEEAE